MIKKSELKDCLKFIDEQWSTLSSTQKSDEGTIIGLPHTFISPSVNEFRCNQFYWDTYFIILGLLETGKLQLAKGMADNLTYMFKRFGIVPMRNRTFNTGISQPPLLTSIAGSVNSELKNKKWYESVMKTAESELNNYWLNSDNDDNIPDHMVYEGLSRYCDHFVTDQTAEHESGWDMTSRFRLQALSYLPIDLNSFLYKYEIDLGIFYKSQNKTTKSKQYLAKAKSRKDSINKLMWDDSNGFFFDYNYRERKREHFWSLAGYTPLWSGLATTEQAKRMVANLDKFEYDGGLANTQPNDLIKPYRQWDYPNGWANIHWLVISGLLDYGYKKEAKRIAEKWLLLNKHVFEETGVFWEKYDVVHYTVGNNGRYEIQQGFGWTNAVFLKLSSMFAK